MTKGSIFRPYFKEAIMKNRKEDSLIHLLQTLYGYSDEQLLEEFKTAEHEAIAEGMQPNMGDFEKLWEEIIKIKR